MSIFDASVLTKLYDIRTSLQGLFKEREAVIDGLLTAMISGEHVLLLGPPGTAKSALVNAVSECVEDARYFGKLLTKYTVPEEVFGPLSFPDLEQGHFHRLMDGYLPTCEFAFIDEVFKANSAILNALLTIANERLFDDDGKRVRCPLLTLVGRLDRMLEPSTQGAGLGLVSLKCLRLEGGRSFSWSMSGSRRLRAILVATTPCRVSWHPFACWVSRGV